MMLSTESLAWLSGRREMWCSGGPCAPVRFCPSLHERGEQPIEGDRPVDRQIADRVPGRIPLRVGLLESAALSGR